MAQNNKWYEIRPRGQFMIQGRVLLATSFENALLNPDIRSHSDNLIIQSGTGDWCVSSWISTLKTRSITAVRASDNNSISPKDSDPRKLLAFAKVCEDICQIGGVDSNIEFTNFEGQLKQYATEQKRFKEIEKKSIVAATECVKECKIAEATIIAGETEKANNAIQIAEKKLIDAKSLTLSSHKLFDFTINSADKALKNAKKQFKKTNKKIEKLQKKAVSTNQDKELGIG